MANDRLAKAEAVIDGLARPRPGDFDPALVYSARVRQLMENMVNDMLKNQCFAGPCQCCECRGVMCFLPHEGHSHRTHGTPVHKLSCDEYHRHGAPKCYALDCWCQTAGAIDPLLAVALGKTDDVDFQRAGADCICESCGKEYWRHPFSEHRSYDNQPYLHRLCDGRLVKL